MTKLDLLTPYRYRTLHKLSRTVYHTETPPWCLLHQRTAMLCDVGGSNADLARLQHLFANIHLITSPPPTSC